VKTGSNNCFSKERGDFIVLVAKKKKKKEGRKEECYNHDLNLGISQK
jgi:hypothetical protein